MKFKRIYGSKERFLLWHRYTSANFRVTPLCQIRSHWRVLFIQKEKEKRWWVTRAKVTGLCRVRAGWRWAIVTHGHSDQRRYILWLYLYISAVTSLTRFECPPRLSRETQTVLTSRLHKFRTIIHPLTHASDLLSSNHKSQYKLIPFGIFIPVYLWTVIWMKSATRA